MQSTSLGFIQESKPGQGTRRAVRTGVRRTQQGKNKKRQTSQSRTQGNKMAQVVTMSSQKWQIQHGKTTHQKQNAELKAEIVRITLEQRQSHLNGLSENWGGASRVLNCLHTNRVKRTEMWCKMSILCSYSKSNKNIYIFKQKKSL